MQIYNKSSHDMSEIESNSVHLVVTSPPYPMIKKWDNLFGTIDFEKQHEYLFKVWQECKRVLVDGGLACINMGDATRSVEGEFCCYPNFAKLTMQMYNLEFKPLVPIIWKKISNKPNAFLGSGFLPTNAYVTQECEYIGIYRKSKKRKFVPKDEDRYKSQFTKEERDVWFSQIWNINGERGAGKTSVFPKEIPYRLVRMFSIRKDTVLDPFCGQGTTGFVSESLNRNFIGYDVEKNQ